MGYIPIPMGEDLANIILSKTPEWPNEKKYRFKAAFVASLSTYRYPCTLVFSKRLAHQSIQVACRAASVSIHDITSQPNFNPFFIIIHSNNLAEVHLDKDCSLDSVLGLVTAVSQ